jgi:RHS repeat-associated protein
LTSTPATLTWDAFNQPATVNSTTATYDALGRMVETGVSGVYTQFVFRPSGDLLAVYKSSGLVKGTLPLPGGEAAVYNSTGLSFLRHKDWLGSSRLATTWTHTVYSRTAYAPFGETYNESGSTPDRSFTGQDQNVATGSAGSGVYDYLFRKYDPSAGRWLSPDPLGWGAVNAADPQSLDRYAYVENQPMNLVDPSGEDYQVCVGVSVGGQGCATVSDDQWNADLSANNPSQTGITVDGFGNIWANGQFQGTVTYVPPAGSFSYIPDIYSHSPNNPSGNGGGSGGGGGGSAPNNSGCKTGFGAGIVVGGDAGVGAGAAGAGGNASAGAALFGGNGINAGVFASGGAGANFFSHARSAVRSLISPNFFGAGVGAGVGIFLTNASQASQLAGPSATWNVDLGWLANGSAQLSQGTDASGNTIYTFSFQLGGGAGALYHNVTNTTVAKGTGKPGC